MVPKGAIRRNIISIFLIIKVSTLFFLDVDKNEVFAEALRQLYDNRRLNFPTVIIKDKRLRNPSDKDLKKWLKKKTNEKH